MRELNNEQWKALDAFKKARKDYVMTQSIKHKIILDKTKAVWEAVKYG